MLDSKMIKVASLLLGSIAMMGCSTTSKNATCCAGCGDSAIDRPAMELPTTRAEQTNMTPDQVLAQLMAGNERYMAGDRTPIDIKASIAVKTEGQYPVAYVLSCVDSRVPVEIVFDQGIGDLFVGRVAGNFENVDQLGSMEFATAAAGAKLVMVLGHEACGAVKGAIDKVELGNLTELLSEIEPSVASVEGERASSNKEFVDKVIEANVRRTVADLRERSEVLANLEKDGKIKIVGGIYSLETGQVTLLD